MAKNIIFCADGTWNTKDEKDHGIVSPTNVNKLYNLLINDVCQLTYYDNGLGARQTEFVKIFEGMTGIGLVEKILDGYQFLMQNWQEGDAIFLFGFSRGAYTVRYLADMMAHLGLLKPLPDESLLAQRQRIHEAYLSYREKQNPSPGAETEYCKITMVGVWDTVGDLGIPLHILSPLNHALFGFHDEILHPSVLYGYQALAIDELRELYKPSLWEKRSGVTQVWFIGSHSDVGGGYADHGLADITLAWMIGKAITHGVLFHAELVNQLGNPYAILHKPWEELEFLLFFRLHREIPLRADIHHTVELRMAKKELAYLPTNLPSTYTFVD
jgi:uncharacterized protein (DUF2235 family)